MSTQKHFRPEPKENLMQVLTSSSRQRLLKCFKLEGPLCGFLVIGAIFLALGCAPASVQIKTGTGYVPFLIPSTELSPNQLLRVAKANAEDLQWFREHEWPLHRNAAYRSEAPRQCVALSGGGIRSAAFSLGVMKGLQNAGLWSKVDVVSAVSGGSYALSWYLAQQYKSRLAGTNQSDADIFGEKPLARLAERAEFVRTVDTVGRGFKTVSPVKWPTFDEDLGCGGILFSSILLHFPPFGPMCTAADYQHRSEDGAFYAGRIADTFHRNDLTDNDEASFPIPIEKLHAMIGDKIPYFVINATVQYREDEDLIPLSGRVFEFTKLRMGSSGVGFLPLPAFGKGVWPDERFPHDLATVVSIAGAALDGEDEHLDWWQQILLKYWSKSNLGYRLPAVDEGDRAIKKAIILTDGGHSENLGVFSLIRRSCENILVVDAGEDPAYFFEDFRRLSQHLHKEYGASLRIPRFPTFESDIVTKQAADDNCVKKGTDKGSSYDCKTAVYEGGSIEGFAILAENGTVKPQKINLTYIKLSASRAVLDDPILANTCYGPMVHDWHKQGDDPKFPHYQTKDQSWTKQQFLAYVSLGEHHVRNYLDPTYKNKCGTAS